MPSNSKEIKRRIKSIRNIGQITKAMELVSAAKMRKAQIAATASRPYSILSAELLRNLISKTDLTHQPLVNRVIPEDMVRLPLQKVLIVLISSDRGLAGAFNSNVITRALALLSQEFGSSDTHVQSKTIEDRNRPDQESAINTQSNLGIYTDLDKKNKFDFVTIGKKGADAVRRLGYNIVASFPMKDKVNILDARPIAEIATADFLGFKYEKVFIIYTDFVSTLVQKPNMLQLLPLERVEGRGSRVEEDFLFEPSVDDVLETLVTRTIEFAVYQTLVEAAASEHSARMVAMRNANEAAGDLIEDLSLSYNQARQAGITRELSEISAAKLAMEG